MSSLGHFQILVFLYALLICSAESRKTPLLNNDNSEGGEEGTRWAVLIAGSNDFDNYRHQADICHAYQLLKKGGLKEENIVVFMYDDIAMNPENPRPGVIINSPDGGDVYNGVPKDYTKEEVNTKNFFNVLLGDESGVTGGSGKVVKSGPNDHIFIYYADHGAPGLLGMPNYTDILYAKDFVKVLEKMYQLNSYKKMVIYVEACESGSIFQGLLKKDLNIYAVTASNAKESSWGTYCPTMYPPPPPDYDACLGDLFSISWLEDSDIHDMSKETLKQQYQVVKRRTGSDSLLGSHVTRFGSHEFLDDYLDSFIGSTTPDFTSLGLTTPDNVTSVGLTTPEKNNVSSVGLTTPEKNNVTSLGLTSTPISISGAVNSRDIPLLYLQRKIQKFPMNSPQRQEAEKKLLDKMNHRKQIDQSITEILRLSVKKSSNVLNLLASTRTTEEPIVDDWDCFKTLVDSFNKYCGATVDYGFKHTGALANLCNMGLDVKQVVSVIQQVCTKI